MTLFFGTTVNQDHNTFKTLEKKNKNNKNVAKSNDACIGFEFSRYRVRIIQHGRRIIIKKNKKIKEKPTLTNSYLQLKTKMHYKTKTTEEEKQTNASSIRMKRETEQRILNTHEFQKCK